MVAKLKSGACRSDAVDGSNALMAQYPSRRATGDIALQDMQVRTANRGFCNLHDGIVGRLYDGLGPFLQGF